MKTVIAGTRTFGNPEIIEKALADSGFQITEVVSGEANGVDTLGEEWANRNNIPIKKYPPDYKKYSPKVAPIMRNHQMAEYADCLVAVWDGKSRGTKDIIDYTENLGKKVFLTIVKNDEIILQEKINFHNKISIIGSSNISDYETVKKSIFKLEEFSNLKVEELVSKKEQSMDYLIQRWATENNIPIKYFFSKEDTGDSKTERNFKMGKYADCIFAIWNGESKGGIHATFEFCKNHKMKLYVFNVKTNALIRQEP